MAEIKAMGYPNSLLEWTLTLSSLGLGLGLILWLVSKRRFILAVIRTLPRDMKALNIFTKVIRDLRYYQWFNYTVAKAFDDTVKKKRDKVLLKYEDQEWTGEQIQNLSFRIANFFQSQGLRKGDTVALFMENGPEYVSMWLGLSRIGCISSLVNYNLRLQPLKHCFEAVNCKAIIFSPGLATALEELSEVGGLGEIPLFCIGEGEPIPSFSMDLIKCLSCVPDTAPVVSERIGFMDNLLYIYTSGTTGLPKAATIKHSRYFMAAVGSFYTHCLNKDDTVYTALPLYHGAGTMLGAGMALTYGVVQVVRKKFSASNFWKDCIKYNCTAAQYIGEVCRYLLAQPANSFLDKSHGVRVMFGNGLKPEIWKDFVERFGIRHISELYGATEGNCNMVNIDDTLGAVGFVPIWCRWILPIKLIKVDEEGVPIRDPRTGHCIPCKPNEAGELIGKIKRNHPISDFEGYADHTSSKDKVLHSAFGKGDSWFRSGDVLIQDEYGYFYFKDRKGDTFRWKGENCSTAEVEAVISRITNLQDAAVFGVEVPGSDGRAGMAVIADPNMNLDMDKFYEGISKALPTYARPLFVRVCAKLEITGTYKLKKIDYQKAGFDIYKVQDKIYFLQGSKYVPLTEEGYNDIMTGRIRL